MLDSHPLKGRTAVLSTKHQKGLSIAPAMETTIGMLVYEAEVDTDLLGTFAGEIERSNGPFETAIHKARMGLDASGELLGLASEGSIGIDPMLPIMVDLEIVVFVNSENGYEVAESFQSFDIIARTICVVGIDGLEEFLALADFPNHGLIVRPADKSHSLVHKGIHDFETLKKSVTEVVKASSDSHAIIETDLRAHHCPSRRINIEKAASKLANRLKNLCPTCDTPGWGVVRVNRGLPCDWCGMKTTLVFQQVFGCSACNYERVQRSALAETADPQWCARCNP